MIVWELSQSLWSCERVDTMFECEAYTRNMHSLLNIRGQNAQMVGIHTTTSKVKCSFESEMSKKWNWHKCSFCWSCCFCFCCCLWFYHLGGCKSGSSRSSSSYSSSSSSSICVWRKFLLDPEYLVFLFFVKLLLHVDVGKLVRGYTI